MSFTLGAVIGFGAGFCSAAIMMIYILRLCVECEENE